MAKHLTDKQKKKIVAYWVECNNYSETARKFKLSPSGVKKIVQEDNESVKKCEQKKEENTQDMLAYMESKKENVFNFMDMVFDDLVDKDKIKRTPINQLVTSLGILMDKYSNVNNGNEVKRVVIVNDLPKDD